MILILLTALTEKFQQSLTALAVNRTVITKLRTLMMQSGEQFLLMVLILKSSKLKYTNGFFFS